ncbi:putative membrane protein [Catalinimonas alkaloidigena]|uniref:cytochrome c oxidase assembly protein n=1 Tax=Catalinimonas alkaloidigena TaxID=1075417 RepID=UPI0024065923|nr:cytochrome c oxidase assembly protein [Catalinimonas alkaloidigena]MDF9797087.1 putative membrane protein [Catalinimonas alkaloidigena]
MLEHAPQENLFTYLPWLFISLMLLAYLRAAIGQIHQGRQWSRWRILSFISGCLLLYVGLTPSLQPMAHHDIRLHMVQHLLIGMFAPLALVLAAPVTLAVRSLPTSTSRFIMQVMGSKPVRLISHPLSALLLNIGGMYVLYLTPLYATTLSNPYMHHLLHLHFLLAGYLFCWSIAGPDPAPHRPAMRVRLIVLFLSMATHAYLSKLMYAYEWPKNTPHPTEQIQAAAQLMYYGGDVAEILLAIAFFAAWFRFSQSQVKKHKKRWFSISKPFAYLFSKN